MKLNLHVKLSDDGPPQVLIPNPYMWDFVEYLGFQRVHVTYIYHDEHFMASFPRIDCAGVQGLLDDWVACNAHSRSVAPCGK